ncbi:MAG: ATP-binding protein [Thermomonas sp.]|uniref:sensor histidine kinase n=1 Tax=Thermomonas sp. TaxID=1971895 RepID=UPI0039E4672F
MTPARPGLSIFRRTFLLLLAALAVAQVVAVVLLLYAPIRTDSTELMRVVALLSSNEPTGNDVLHVATSAARPVVPAEGGFRTDARVRTAIAQWLSLDEEDVLFVSTREARKRRAPPSPDGKPPPPDCTDCPSGPPREAGSDVPAAQDGESRPPPRPRNLAPDTPLRGEFIAAARQPDGRWRVVESTQRNRLGRIGRQAGLLFLAGVLVLLPLAWWFSRALSAPIREFARAADHLGRNPDAPPLARNGPHEIVLAVDSFNAMQTRLNRMVAERTQMVGAIAHDLRTPLARLAFRLQKLPDDQRDKAQDDIDEMKTMITAALDFLRDRSATGLREALDMRSLVENMVNGLADTGRDIALESGAAVIVNGDRIALRRMVANLIDNALKYGKRARLRLQAQDGDCVLEVEDDGPGIDPAQAEQLFMPFYRGEASRNRETGGIGLGLSVAQGIAVEHGGRIVLENQPAGGLRATAIIPLP